MNRILYALLLLPTLCFGQGVRHTSTKGNKISTDTILTTQVVTQTVFNGGFYCNPYNDSLNSFTMVGGILYVKGHRTLAWDTVKGYTTPTDSTIYITNTHLRDTLLNYTEKWLTEMFYIGFSDSSFYTTRHRFDSTINSLVVGGGISLSQLNDTLTHYYPRWLGDAIFQTKTNLVTSLGTPDNLHYPSSLAVVNYLNSNLPVAGYGLTGNLTVDTTKIVSHTRMANFWTLLGSNAFTSTSYYPASNPNSYTSNLGTVISVSAGPGLSGGSWTTSGTVSLPNVGTASTYGDATHIPSFTTDAFGRISGVTVYTFSSGGTVTGTTNRITVSSGVVDISASYVGQTSITTLGIITGGTWQGNAIADGFIASASTWNAKQSSLSGTGYVKFSGTTPSYSSTIPFSDITGAQNQLITVTGTGDATWSTSATNTLIQPVVFATVNGNVGNFGSATQTTTVTVNGKGLVTAIGNVTITPALASITGLASNMATFLSTSSSANLIATVTDETGTGNLVFSTSPSLVTPILGTPTSGTLSNCTGFPVSSLSGTTLPSGITLLTTSGTASNSIASIDGIQTLSNKRWKPRVGSTTSSGTPTINTDNFDIYKLTAQAANITSFTTNLTGTPNDGDIFQVQITGTSSFTLSWGTSFVSGLSTLPTTITTTTNTIILQYYATSSYGTNKWVCTSSY